jgi:hypothetical protein
MKRYRIQITHELEFPDNCELRTVAGESVLKIGEVLIHPAVDYLGAIVTASDTAQFTELGESDRDRIYAALTNERTIITEL